MKVYNKNDVDVTFSDWHTDLEQLTSFDAIPLDKVKQAREEMNDLDYLINDAKYSDWETRICNVDILVSEFYEIMNKLIAESED